MKDSSQPKQTQTFLREDEQRWASTLASIGDALITMDVSGNITYMNAAAEELTGWSVPEATQKPLLEVFNIINEEARLRFYNPVTDILREVKSVGLADHTLLIRSDGIEIPIDDSGALIRDKDGSATGIVIVFRDITDRRRTEKALRASEERYHSLFDNMLNGFAHCKMLFDEKGPKDFIYLDVNKAFKTLTGLKDVTGQKVSDVIPGIQEYDPELFEIYVRVALTGVPEQFETYLEALGMWLSISVYSSRKEYFVAVFDVITERKRDEEALRRYRDELEALVQERTEELEKAHRETEAEIVERRTAEETLRQTNRLLKLYTAGSSRKEYLEAVMGLLREWTGCEALGIRGLDKLGNIPYESYSGFSREFWESECFLSIHTDQCVCTRIVRKEPDAQDMPFITNGGSFFCDDTAALASTLSPKEMERFRGKCISTGYATVAVIPISYQNRVLGVAHLADRAKARIPRKT
ncbi:MAG: PAS domain S-box protein, partial [Deltaproteobacteria bacterium]